MKTHYKTEEITKTLQAARVSKGLSQRALSQRAGVPQAHISKIESGAVDLRLSSLIALARVLDLEVALVPRKAVPAVQSIVRSSEPAASPSTPAVVKELQRLQHTLGAISELTNGPKELAQLQRQIRELQHFRLADEHLAALKDANSVLQAVKNHKKGTEDIRRVLTNVQTLRNAIAHQTSSVSANTAARPAYTLDDEASNGSSQRP
jgi:transcriptional regulator with XRE-family HTH domain